MRQAVLIFNPRAGRWRTRRLATEIVPILERGGFAVEPLPTSGPGDATLLGRHAADRGAEVAFAFGGDGTLREVAAGVLGSSTAVAFLPGGTTNVMARELLLPRRAEAAARVLRTAVVREMDVGLVNREPFLMMASAGIDARIVADLEPRLKRLVGTAAVVPPGLRAWWSHADTKIELTVEGRSLSATFVSVSNIALYGGGIRIAPGALFDDRLLDVVIFHGRGRWHTLAFARDLLLGRHLDRDDVEVLRVERAVILAPPGLPLQIDGDAFAGQPPYEIGLAPQRLRLLAPAPLPRPGL